MNNCRRIIENKFLILLLLIPFFIPLSFKYIPILNVIYVGLSILRVAIFVILSVAFVWNLLKGNGKKKFHGLFYVAIFELLIMVSSLLNSESLYNPLKNFITIFSICFIVNYYVNIGKARKFFDILFWMYTVLNVVNLASIIIYKEKGIQTAMYQNDVNLLYFMNIDNGIALINVLMIYLTIVKVYFSKSKIYWLFLLIPLLSCIFVDSASGKLITFILLGLILLKKFVNLKLFCFCGSAVVACCFLIIISNHMPLRNVFLDIISEILNRDITLSGRTYLWQKSINMISNKPFLGYGDSIMDHIEIWGGYYSAHNFYLEILLDGGIVSFICFLIILIKSCESCIKLKNQDISKLSLFVMSTLLIYFFVEALGNNVQFFMVIISILEIEKITKEKNGRRLELNGSNY